MGLDAYQLFVEGTIAGSLNVIGYDVVPQTFLCWVSVTMRVSMAEWFFPHPNSWEERVLIASLTWVVQDLRSFLKSKVGHRFLGTAMLLLPGLRIGTDLVIFHIARKPLCLSRLVKISASMPSAVTVIIR